MVIDLRSDTKTLPTESMRAAMAEASVGDEQVDEDPTVNALCEKVADLLGKEAAVFLPSGTMCNVISMLVHCSPGDEVLAASVAHLLNSEAAGTAALAGAQIRALPGVTGIFTGEAVSAAVMRQQKRNAPRTRVVSIEQTCNRGGGAVWPLAALQEVSDAAREHGLAVHIDGARLLNAVIVSEIAARRHAAVADSVWIDLTKGLGCPVGAVLAGDSAFITQAWRWKQRLGGAMRQAGMLAAAGLYALEHHVQRLAEDHWNARLLADGLAQFPEIRLAFEKTDTNIVIFDIVADSVDAKTFATRLKQHDIAIGVEGPRRLRAVTHLNVDEAGIVRTLDAMRGILSA